MTDQDEKILNQHTPENEATESTGKQESEPRKLSVEERAKQLAKVVCICKGINLGRVLKVLDSCETVADVNKKAGTGSGGCQGQRCGPRIKLLLSKKHKT